MVSIFNLLFFNNVIGLIITNASANSALKEWLLQILMAPLYMVTQHFKTFPFSAHPKMSLFLCVQKNNTFGDMGNHIHSTF